MAERKRNTLKRGETTRRKSVRSRRSRRTLRRVPCTITLNYSISVPSADKDTRKYIMEGEIADNKNEISIEYPGFPFLGLFYPEKCTVKIPKDNRNSVVITGLDERLFPLGLRTFVCEEGENISTYDTKDSLISAVGLPSDYTVRTEKLVNTVTMLGGDIEITFDAVSPAFGTISVEYSMNVTPHNGYYAHSDF